VDRFHNQSRYGRESESDDRNQGRIHRELPTCCFKRKDLQLDRGCTWLLRGSAGHHWMTDLALRAWRESWFRSAPWRPSVLFALPHLPRRTAQFGIRGPILCMQSGYCTQIVHYIGYKYVSLSHVLLFWQYIMYRCTKSSGISHAGMRCCCCSSWNKANKNSDDVGQRKARNSLLESGP
jgi:hypothetical protein